MMKAVFASILLQMSLFSVAYGLSRQKMSKMKPVIFPQYIETNELKYKDYVRLVPSNLQPTAEGTDVAIRFGDQALQNLLNSPQVKNSAMGRSAAKVENAMKTEVSIAPPAPNKGPNPIDHKISFQVLALQSQARMKYKGWAEATVTHDIRVRETDVEISEKLFRNKDVFIKQTTTTSENRSSVGIRWNW